MTRIVSVAFALGLTLGVFVGVRLTAQPPASTRTSLLTVDIGEGKEARMWIAEIAPGAATGMHFHPGNAVGYMLQGSIVHTVKGQQPHTITAGQAWHEAERDVHEGRNPSATTPAKLLAVQIADKSRPATVPVN